MIVCFKPLKIGHLWYIWLYVYFDNTIIWDIYIWDILQPTPIPTPITRSLSIISYITAHPHLHPYHPQSINYLIYYTPPPYPPLSHAVYQLSHILHPPPHTHPYHTQSINYLIYYSPPPSPPLSHAVYQLSHILHPPPIPTPITRSLSIISHALIYDHNMRKPHHWNQKAHHWNHHTWFIKAFRRVNSAGRE